MSQQEAPPRANIKTTSAHPWFYSLFFPFSSSKSKNKAELPRLSPNIPTVSCCLSPRGIAQ